MSDTRASLCWPKAYVHRVICVLILIAPRRRDWRMAMLHSISVVLLRFRVPFRVRVPPRPPPRGRGPSPIITRTATVR